MDVPPIMETRTKHTYIEVHWVHWDSSLLAYRVRVTAYYSLGRRAYRVCG